jgi:hypothetical protein
MVSFTSGKIGDPGFVDPNSPEAKAMVNPSIEDDFVENKNNDQDEVKKISTGISVAMRNKLAVNIMRVEIPLNIIDELNQHIDDVIVPAGQDLSDGLVGQINQHEKSGQWVFPHEDDGAGEQFANVLNQLAKTYIKQTLADTGDDNKEIKTDVQNMWTVHSYAGDYNPLHDHGTRSYMGLSCILYLKVPPQIEAIGLPSEEMIAAGVTPGFQGLNGASGAVDGFTYLCWGVNGMRDVSILRPIQEEYVKPEVGTMIMFPAWLRHAVMPFSGEGERRTFSANINVDMQ